MTNPNDNNGNDGAKASWPDFFREGTTEMHDNHSRTRQRHFPLQLPEAIMSPPFRRGSGVRIENLIDILDAAIQIVTEGTEDATSSSPDTHRSKTKQ